MGTSPARTPPWSDAFRILFDAHAAYVARCARFVGVPAADVPDVVQAVFLALHEAMGRGFDLAGPARPWLRAVTCRTARDHLKLARHARELVTATGSVEAADRVPNAEQRMEAIDAQRLVEEVLDVLPPEQRIVLVMSDIEEMPMSEIAEVLEIPIGTGYSRLRAARRDFLAAWNRRRATGHAAVLPFALWEPGDLFHAARSTQDLPREIMDEVWRRLVSALGPGIVGAAVAGAAVAASAAKAGAVLTAKQATLGALAALLVGAGLHALLGPALVKAPPPEVVAGRDTTPAAAAASAPSTAATMIATTPVSPSPSPTASTRAATCTADDDASERKWLEKARDAMEAREFGVARDALARVRCPRFSRNREELRRRLRAYEDGGP